MRRVAGIAGIGLVVTAIALPVARAATTTTTLLGFGTSAVANGATAVYFDPAAPVPASPTAEGDADHTEAALQSGPVGRALASTAWPGALIAGVGPALGFVLPVNPGVGAYPVRAQASYPQGASSSSNTSVPGNAMAASAAASGVNASATSNQSDSPAAVVKGSLHSEVHQASSATAILSNGSATASNVSILGGVVHFDSITSTASLRSDGRTPVLSGDTRVSGATVGGVPVTIDASGARVGTGGTDAGGPTASAESVFRQVGVTVTVARPIDVVSSRHAERIVGGVLVAIDGRAFSAYVASLPAPEAKAIGSAVNAQQQLLLAFGAVDVSVDIVSGSAPSLTMPVAVAPASPAGEDTGAALAPAPMTAPPVAAPQLTAPPAAPAVRAPAGPRTGLGTRAFAPAAWVAKKYRGLSAWGVAVAALLALGAASPLWRLTTGALDPDALPEECPLETRRVAP